MYNMLYVRYNSDINVYYSSACAIEDPDKGNVIVTGGITGGIFNRKIVSVYNRVDWEEDLPSLNTGRWYHACTSYMSSGTRVT